MLDRVEIVIDGKPRGKQRPTYGNGVARTPEQTVIEEAHIRRLGSKAMQGRPASVGPIRVTLEAVFDMPVSWPSRVREMKNLPHLSTPDLDNIEKLVLDGLNGVVWQDDCQVCELIARKRYGEGNRVHVIIEELVTTCDHPAVTRRVAKSQGKDRISRRSKRGHGQRPKFKKARPEKPLKRTK